MPQNYYLPTVNLYHINIQQWLRMVAVLGDVYANDELSEPAAPLARFPTFHFPKSRHGTSRGLAYTVSFGIYSIIVC